MIRTCSTFVLILIATGIAFVTCTPETSPYTNPDNVAVSISVVNDIDNIHIGDTVTADIQLYLPELISAIEISIHTFDSVIAEYRARDEDWDSLRVTWVADTVGNHDLKVLLTLVDGNVIEQSVPVLVKGSAPVIDKSVSGSLYKTEDIPCTLFVDVSGNGPFEFRWKKSGALVGSDSLLIFDPLKLAHAGDYHCVVQSPWGKDSSLLFTLIVQEKGTPPAPVNVHIEKQSTDLVKIAWNKVGLAEKYEVYRGTDQSAAIDPLGTTSNTYFNDDTLVIGECYWVKSLGGGKISGPSSAACVQEIDTTIELPDSTTEVPDSTDPAFYELKVSAEHGVVTVEPKKDQYLKGDSITVTAKADDGYSFSGWSGPVTGTELTKKFVITENSTLTANFWPVASTECTPVNDGGNLDDAIKKACKAAKKPSIVCPEPGKFNTGTVEILGTVKFVFD